MTESDREREAQTLFGRSLADATFRKALQDRGIRGYDQDVVVTLDETPIRDVLRRVFARCRPPALVAIRRERERHGFAFLVFAPMVGGTRAVGPDRVHLSASIGALYDSLLAGGPRTIELTDELGYDIESAVPPGLEPVTG